MVPVFLIHRDLKPSNILLSQDGTPKIQILDWLGHKAFRTNIFGHSRNTSIYVSRTGGRIGIKYTVRPFSVGLIMYEII